VIYENDAPWEKSMWLLEPPDGRKDDVTISGARKDPLPQGLQVKAIHIPKVG